jgi:citrate lyase beta subunit
MLWPSSPRQAQKLLPANESTSCQISPCWRPCSTRRRTVPTSLPYSVVRRDLGVCSIAVCLEDAVRPEDRQAAAAALCRTLTALEFCPALHLYRPADVAALEWLIEHLPLEHISGFILPKATVAKIHLWVERSAGLHTLLPILESREALDPVGRRELAQACAAHPPLIPGARIGANDLFSLLGGCAVLLGARFMKPLSVVSLMNCWRHSAPIPSDFAARL